MIASVAVRRVRRAAGATGVPDHRPRRAGRRRASCAARWPICAAPFSMGLVGR